MHCQPSFLSLKFFKDGQGESNFDFNHRTQLYLNFILIWSYKAICIWKYVDLSWRSRELSAEPHCMFITEKLSESWKADQISRVYWWVFSWYGVLERFARAQLFCEQGRLRHGLCSLKWHQQQILGLQHCPDPSPAASWGRAGLGAPQL